MRYPPWAQIRDLRATGDRLPQGAHLKGEMAMAELTEADLLALDTELARLPDRHEGTYVEARLALAEKVPRLLATIRMLWARLEEAGELGGKMADVCFTVGQQR